MVLYIAYVRLALTWLLALGVLVARPFPASAQGCLIGHPACAGAFQSLLLPTPLQFGTRIHLLNTHPNGEYVLQLTPDEAAASPFNLTIAGFPTPGESTRLNQVVRLGWNLGLGGQRDDPADAALGLEFEHHWAPEPGQTFVEHHLAYVNRANVVYRPMSWQINKATDFIDAYIRADSFNWLSGAAGQQWMVFQPHRVFLDGSFTATGAKSALVETASDGPRKLYAVESPEHWFEDFGSAVVVGGQVVIALEAIFRETVTTTAPYHVFLTPQDACTPYVTAKTPESFTVRVREGEPACAVDYRVVAKRRGYEPIRLEAGGTASPAVRGRASR